MPGFTLRLRGEPRDQEVRVEAWPVTVSPLVPEDVSPRRGLGELQPDAGPPLIDIWPVRWRLIAYVPYSFSSFGARVHGPILLMSGAPAGAPEPSAKANPETSDSDANATIDRIMSASSKR